MAAQHPGRRYPALLDHISNFALSSIQLHDIAVKLRLCRKDGICMEHARMQIEVGMQQQERVFRKRCVVNVQLFSEHQQVSAFLCINLPGVFQIIEPGDKPSRLNDEKTLLDELL